MRHGRLAAASVVLLAMGFSLAVFDSDVNDEPPSPAPVERVAKQTRLPAGGRGCSGRVEGGRLSASSGRDTTIGPVSFLHAGSAYRTAAAAGSGFSVRGIPGSPMKVVALVTAGRQVTLAVPREQRRWMRLLYDLSGRPTSRITLRACRTFLSREAQRRECGYAPRIACQWRNTQFSGGFAVSFDKAPQRGRCAELAVRVAGRPGVLRRPLFLPLPPSCARTAKLPTLGRLPAGSQTYSDRKHDLRVSIPRGWHRARRTITPRLAKPADVLALGNFAPRVEPGRACTSAPDSPQLRVGSRDALVLVTQDGNPNPPPGPGQPDSYRLLKQVRPVGRGGPNRTPGSLFPWTCVSRVGVSGLWTVFIEDGRAFYVTAIVGEKASEELRRQALGVLDSLEFGEE